MDMSVNKLRKHEIKIKTDEESLCWLNCNCGYKSKRLSNMSRHIKTMHSEKINQDLICCGRNYTDKASYRVHCKVHHMGGYQCELCPRKFARRALLLRHDSVHTGQCNYNCDLCDYKSSHKSNLERHVDKKHASKMPKPDSTTAITGLSSLPKNSSLFLKTMLQVDHPFMVPAPKTKTFYKRVSTISHSINSILERPENLNVNFKEGNGASSSSFTTAAPSKSEFPGYPGFSGSGSFHTSVWSHTSPISLQIEQLESQQFLASARHSEEAEARHVVNSTYLSQDICCHPNYNPNSPYGPYNLFASYYSGYGYYGNNTNTKGSMPQPQSNAQAKPQPQYTFSFCENLLDWKAYNQHQTQNQALLYNSDYPYSTPRYTTPDVAAWTYPSLQVPGSPLYIYAQHTNCQETRATIKDENSVPPVLQILSENQIQRGSLSKIEVDEVEITYVPKKLRVAKSRGFQIN